MNRSSRTISIILLFLALLSAVSAAFAMSRFETADPSEKLGYVFFIEPFYSMLNVHGVNGAVASMVAFSSWLIVACLLARMQNSKQRLSLAFLVIFPALAICALNAIAAGDAASSIEPAAIVAVLGTLLYHAGRERRWSRLFLFVATLAVCSLYGMHTGMGLLGGLVAASTMAVVVTLWSGLNTPVYSLTFSGHGRKFQYR